MRKRFMILFFVALVFMSCAGNTASGVIMDSINASQEPLGVGWGIEEIGWVYTPSSSYVLTGIQTMMAAASRDHLETVVVELYDAAPCNSGVLLRSGTFKPSMHYEFVGGTFVSIELEAGEDYFVGFRNVGSMLDNFSYVGETLPCYSGFENRGIYPDFTDHPAAIRPILQFEGYVPEPGTVLLLGLGAMVVLRKPRS